MTKCGEGRGTRKIGVMAATNVLHAIRFAQTQGKPLNVSVTLSWHCVGLNTDEGKNLFKQLRQKIRRQWVYRNQSHKLILGSFDDVKVHEAPGGLANTHWLVRVPDNMRLEFETSVNKFLQKMILSVDVKSTNLIHFAQADAPGQLAKYFLKGIDPKYKNYFHIDPVDQGFIPGTGRTAVSRTIGFTARKRAGWKRNKIGNTASNRQPTSCVPEQIGSHVGH